MFIRFCYKTTVLSVQCKCNTLDMELLSRCFHLFHQLFGELLFNEYSLQEGINVSVHNHCLVSFGVTNRGWVKCFFNL